MAKRKRVGIIFSYQEKWVAGAYYVLNLVHALNALPDDEKPHIVGCIENDKDRQHLLGTQYPYLSFANVNQPRAFPIRLLNKLLKAFSGKDHFPYGLNPALAEGFFPFVLRPEVARIPFEKQIHWIPDFQDNRMPEFFPADELDLRKKRNGGIAESPVRVVFSSKDAEKDFRQFYPQQKTRNFVAHFAVTHPPIASIDADAIRKKFNLPDRWFLAPNQFWKHKNQPLIIKAVARLKEKGIKVNVLFTGKEDDFRNPGYAEGVKKMARDLDVQEECRFLGFIDRAEQIWLMQHADAVIQASLFEGWSTVVEDAKALQKPVILSDLPVHREQLQQGVLFFDPLQADSLAQAILMFRENKTPSPPGDYQEMVKEFGRNFMAVMNA